MADLGHDGRDFASTMANVGHDGPWSTGHAFGLVAVPRPSRHPARNLLDILRPASVVLRMSESRHAVMGGVA